MINNIGVPKKLEQGPRVDGEKRIGELRTQVGLDSTMKGDRRKLIGNQVIPWLEVMTTWMKLMRREN